MSVNTLTPPEQGLRYAVYTIRNTLEDGLVYAKSFIVVKNAYRVIVRFTRFHEYAGLYPGGICSITTDVEMRLHFICAFLNYALADHVSEFGIRHVFDITKPIMERFFNQYAQEKQENGHYRSRESVERCVQAVTDFMGRLCAKFDGYMKLHKSDLFEEQTRRSHNGQLVKKQVPSFRVAWIPTHDGLLRDIPTKVMEILLTMAFRYTEDIAFGMCLQAFAGLRAGEVCNVRQESSPLGAGIRFVETGGRVIKAEIDLRRELALRSDRVEIGKIKKERLQCVYPQFLDVFQQALKLHRAYLRKVKYEQAYAPMFVNQRGKAMSYGTYRDRFKKLICDHLRPYLAKSDDPELRIYGQMLYESTLGTHSLRHWYTVQLVLHGEDIAGVQFWRGDRSPESAFLYLQNKGDLVHELKDTNERMFTELFSLGAEFHEN